MIGIVVHGGAGGTSRAAQGSCRQAAQIGMEVLRSETGSALTAVVKAVEHLENSGVVNAGVGSILRFDGATIQMDAVIATSKGLERAVEVVEDVKNPILLVFALAQTPYLKLAGQGATEYARRLVLPRHPGPSTYALNRHARLLNAIRRGRLEIVAPGWDPEVTRQLLDLIRETQENGDDPCPPSIYAQKCDTVGAIAHDKSGEFALAASTGGMGIMPRGRVGDVPVRGAGFQIGPYGGVLATGVGEEIIRVSGAKKVFSFLQTHGPQRACEIGLQFFDPDVPVGFIALTRDGAGIASNPIKMPAFHLQAS